MVQFDSFNTHFVAMHMGGAMGKKIDILFSNRMGQHGGKVSKTLERKNMKVCQTIVNCHWLFLFLIILTALGKT